jgi:hypothetical protein
MIIRDFDIIRVAIAPLKTDPPLFIDAYAVLALPVAFQGRHHAECRRTYCMHGLEDAFPVFAEVRIRRSSHSGHLLSLPLNCPRGLSHHRART